jgi:hypothetical protein
MTPEKRLAELGLELPPPNPPVASYVGAVTVGNQRQRAYLSVFFNMCLKAASAAPLERARKGVTVSR